MKFEALNTRVVVVQLAPPGLGSRDLDEGTSHERLRPLTQRVSTQPRPEGSLQLSFKVLLRLLLAPFFELVGEDKN